MVRLERASEPIQLRLPEPPTVPEDPNASTSEIIDSLSSQFDLIQQLPDGRYRVPFPEGFIDTPRPVMARAVFALGWSPPLTGYQIDRVASETGESHYISPQRLRKVLSPYRELQVQGSGYFTRYSFTTRPTEKVSIEELAEKLPPSTADYTNHPTFDELTADIYETAEPVPISPHQLAFSIEISDRETSATSQGLKIDNVIYRGRGEIAADSNNTSSTATTREEPLIASPDMQPETNPPASDHQYLDSKLSPARNKAFEPPSARVIEEYEKLRRLRQELDTIDTQLLAEPKLIFSADNRRTDLLAEIIRAEDYVYNENIQQYKPYLHPVEVQQITDAQEYIRKDQRLQFGGQTVLAEVRINKRPTVDLAIHQKRYQELAAVGANDPHLQRNIKLYDRIVNRNLPFLTIDPNRRAVVTRGLDEITNFDPSAFAVLLHLARFPRGIIPEKRLQEILATVDSTRTITDVMDELIGTSFVEKFGARGVIVYGLLAIPTIQEVATRSNSTVVSPECIDKTNSGIAIDRVITNGASYNTVGEQADMLTSRTSTLDTSPSGADPDITLPTPAQNASVEQAATEEEQQPRPLLILNPDTHTARAISGNTSRALHFRSSKAADILIRLAEAGGAPVSTTTLRSIIDPETIFDHNIVGKTMDHIRRVFPEITIDVRRNRAKSTYALNAHVVLEEPISPNAIHKIDGTHIQPQTETTLPTNPNITEAANTLEPDHLLTADIPVLLPPTPAKKSGVTLTIKQPKARKSPVPKSTKPVASKTQYEQLHNDSALYYEPIHDAQHVRQSEKVYGDGSVPPELEYMKKELVEVDLPRFGKLFIRPDDISILTSLAGTYRSDSMVDVPVDPEILRRFGRLLGPQGLRLSKSDSQYYLSRKPGVITAHDVYVENYRSGKTAATTEVVDADIASNVAESSDLTAEVSTEPELISEEIDEEKEEE